MESTPCVRCGVLVDYDPAFFPKSWLIKIQCEACSHAVAEQDRKERRGDQLNKVWARKCPPLYQDTVQGRLPLQDKSTNALEWKFEDAIGLNLWGFPDTGKTRTLYLVLKALHFAGRKVLVFAPGRFEIELGTRDFKRSRWIMTLCDYPFLAFDDFDKLNLTKEQELVLFQIIDYRMANRLPLLLTHNSTADALEYKFRQGVAMVRRIREFTHSIHFPEKTLWSA